MVDYGGADTRSLTQADYQGRREALQAQMNAAEEKNRMMQGYGQQVQGGLDRGAQAAEQQKNRDLEAARSGLEYDPNTKKYIESGPAREKRGFQQTMEYKDYELRRDTAASGVIQRQEQINQEGQRLKEESGLRQQHSMTEMAHAKNEAMREARLLQEAQFEQGQKRQELLGNIDGKTDKQLSDISDLQLKLELGDAESSKGMRETLSIMAQKDPTMQQALKDLQSGKQTPEGMARMRTALGEMRNQVAISGAAKTGYMSGLVDPTSPTMQRFYQFRQMQVIQMEADMQNEVAYLNSLPPDMRRKEQKNAFFSSMSQDDRVRAANQAAALIMLGVTQAQTAAAGGFSGGPNAGAGGAGPQQQTKLGGSSSQPTDQSGRGFYQSGPPVNDRGFEIRGNPNDKTQYR